jgi:3-dehydroquinate synthase
VIRTLPEREYRAGLYEIIKCGVIRDAGLFEVFETDSEGIASRNASTVDKIIVGAVRIKAEVVSADEKESDLRRILNYGHTIGHALEVETGYVRFLHGEAVAFGMVAAARLAMDVVGLEARDAERIAAVTTGTGPIPELAGIDSERLFSRFASDKKTLHGKVHFVLPVRIGDVRVVSGVPKGPVIDAIEWAINRYAALRTAA